MKSFVKKFTKEEIPFTKIGKEYYLLTPQMQNIVDAAEKQPFGAGIFLGKDDKDFKPSLALLQILSEKSDRKIFVTDEGEWLFLCGRDLFENNVKGKDMKGLVLVQNKNDENLGLGLIRPGKVAVKNILDRGDLLRREM